MSQTKKHTNTLLEEKDLYLALSSNFVAFGWKYSLVRYLPNGNRIVVKDGFEDVKQVRSYLLQ